MAGQTNKSIVEHCPQAEPNRYRAHNHLRLLLTIPLLLISCAPLPHVNTKRIKVEGTAMAPTLNDGDIIPIDERVENIERGDIVIFWYPEDPSKSFIKRIIAVGGETIRMDNRGRLFIDGRPMDEPYLSEEKNQNPRVIPETYVKPHYYFVMGDNRDASNDSRSWGLVPEKYVWGKYIRR